MKAPSEGIRTISGNQLKKSTWLDQELASSGNAARMCVPRRPHIHHRWPVIEETGTHVCPSVHQSASSLGGSEASTTAVGSEYIDRWAFAEVQRRGCGPGYSRGHKVGEGPRRWVNGGEEGYDGGIETRIAGALNAQGRGWTSAGLKEFDI